ncbi:cingulin-like [Ruditapes philippinarum]|uniref:cingulin-like n=1 Tax=Ruditapes philippinarum TaxID=129788 RepID=UPI00295B0B74|nr:cingulin-like [Ruditapes philippinarum]XP_060602213.1 cingulin-like [Ruditapes philippinarum]XP_060602214.1 cingulin-like [Ruditapes philippinarum]
MGKKKLIDLVTISVEDKLDSNGALRNVAVKDAWQRLRQNIDVREWKDAENVLKELSDNLQKINMLKSMTGTFSKLKSAIKTPDEMVEENDFHSAKDTPRDDKRESLQIANDLKNAREDSDGLCACLKIVKDALEKDNDVPGKINVPSGANENIKDSYRSLIFICEKCKKTLRENEQLKKRIESIETRHKEMEKKIDEKEKEINQMTQTVDLLEKKHSSIKESKQDNMKEQLKVKSLERQVLLKDTEMYELKQENENLKKRINEIMDEKGSELADLYNPFPPEKLAEQFKDLFNTAYKESFEFYKTKLKKTEKDAAGRLLQILYDACLFCTEFSVNQMQKVMSEFIYPGDTPEAMHDLSKVEESDVKQMHNLRKQTCRLSCEFVKNSFVTKLESANGETYTFDELTVCMPYIESSVEICWFLNVQTPPMHIGFEDNALQDIAVDKTKYEITSGKGVKVDIVMWPPLYRSQDGQLMSKGCIKTK